VATRELRTIESRSAACFHAGRCAEELMKALLIHLDLMSPDGLATLDGPLAARAFAVILDWVYQRGGRRAPESFPI